MTDGMTDKEPTPEEVVASIERSFEEYVRPLWAEWDKDVRVKRIICAPRF